MDQFIPGEKVHYIPYSGCSINVIENGIVKSSAENSESEIRVVYHCNNDWENYSDYTSALTPISQLRKGWKEDIDIKSDTNFNII